jgi:hypothetical protein
VGQVFAGSEHSEMEEQERLCTDKSSAGKMVCDASEKEIV